MTEKAISKHLSNLEKQFAANNSVLQQATKIFHDLDQVEYDLGLLDQDETTARKSSWWPIVSLISDDSLAKTTFLNQFLGSAAQAANVHSASHKFTVFQHTPQATLATLPGSALDVDHRLPFYNISHKIEQFSAGEGSKINSYLELKTLNSPRLRNRLLIETPDFNSIAQHPVRLLLNQQVIEMSDLVLVFTSVFESDSIAKTQLIEHIIAHQDANKFIYIIDHIDITLTPERIQTSIASWKKRLAGLGLNTGQFIIFANIQGLLQNPALVEIDERLVNIDNDRSYRVLHTLEKGIRDVHDVVIPEVSSALKRWKERCNFSTLIILGLIISILLFAEISMGILDLLIDPIIGPLALLGLLAVLIPLHIVISKMHAKSFVKELYARQKALHLSENLAAMFEKSLSFWRIVLPINEPVGNSKKYRTRLRLLNERSKNLVQALNDNFSADTRYEPETLPLNPYNSDE
ncbi:MAG: hypothetical protein HOP02_05665 [Methylococcaceae bacterium]|nr:hypothetical protein [Methylococcaceae bacterium]